MMKMNKKQLLFHSWKITAEDEFPLKKHFVYLFDV